MCLFLANFNILKYSSSKIIKRITSSCSSSSLSCYRIPVSEISQENLIFVDTETTGLNHDAQMIQISAKQNKTHARCINFYCLPNTNISKGAARVNGFKVINDKLYYKNEQVNTVSVCDAINNLTKLANNENESQSKYILVAHNAPFDAKIIISSAIQNDLIQDLRRHFIGFIDTLAIFKNCHPNLTSYKQTSLVSYFLNGEYEAHNAQVDVHLLHNLFKKAIDPLVTNDMQVLSNASFTIDYSIEQYLNIEQQYKLNISSFDQLIMKNVINKDVASRLARKGISFDTLKKLLVEEGEKAIKTTLMKADRYAMRSYHKLICHIKASL